MGILSTPEPSPLPSPQWVSLVSCGLRGRSPGGGRRLGLHLVVAAVSQQGHKDAKASKVDDLLAELISHSQAGQGAEELAQDSWVVRERCAEAGREELELGGARDKGMCRKQPVSLRSTFHFPSWLGSSNRLRREMAPGRFATPPAP